jgi:hypothetical protein
MERYRVNMQDAASFSSDYSQRIQLTALRCAAGQYPYAIAFLSIRCTSFGQWREFLGDIMYSVERAPFVENIDSMETARIPKYREHEFFRLDRMTLPFRNFSFCGSQMNS